MLYKRTFKGLVGQLKRSVQDAGRRVGFSFFDNDRNRDVTAAIIGRFYADPEKNHNVQYAMSGLAHLIERYGTDELIGAVAALSPIAKELNSPSERSVAGILDAMALHPQTPLEVLRKLLPSRAALLARREPLVLEAELMAGGKSMSCFRRIQP